MKFTTLGCWSSHLRSISSIMKMFSATCLDLNNIVEKETTHSQRGDAHSACEAITSFEFIFILHLMKEVMEITDKLCQALQRKSQDILNAIDLVSNTKALLQNMRDTGWDSLLLKVKSFCETHNVEVPTMSDFYVARVGRARHQQDRNTIEHHYRVDIFIAMIDSQLQELNSHFSENVVEFLTLSYSLDPRDGWKSFNADNVYNLMENYYPQDFTTFEK